MQQKLGSFRDKFDAQSRAEIEVDLQRNLSHATSLGRLGRKEGTVMLDAAEVAFDFLLPVFIGGMGTKRSFLSGGPHGFAEIGEGDA